MICLAARPEIIRDPITMTASIANSRSGAAAPAEGSEHTFLFADLAGFTALTEAHGDEHAADLVGEFSDRVRGWLADGGGGDAKTIGDAVMLRCPAAAGAVELGLKIVEEVYDLPGFPVVCVGMHFGSAVERDGDWFGAAVNLAARVSAAAGGGDVLLTEATREAAGPLEGIELSKLGPRRFKNVGEPVTLYRARRWRVDARKPVIDPVCRMTVAPEHAAGRLTHREREYLFCSLECASAFATDPDRYTGEHA